MPKPKTKPREDTHESVLANSAKPKKDAEGQFIPIKSSKEALGAWQNFNRYMGLSFNTWGDLMNVPNTLDSARTRQLHNRYTAYTEVADMWHAVLGAYLEQAAKKDSGIVEVPVTDLPKHSEQLLSEMKERAAEQVKKYPQYAGYFNDCVLATARKEVMTKMGIAAEAGEIVLFFPNMKPFEEGNVHFWSIRNKVVTVVTPDFLRVLGSRK